MSLQSMAQDSAIRLGNHTPTLEEMVKSAATAAAEAAKGSDSVDAATDAGISAARISIAKAAPVPSNLLSELVKYIPTDANTFKVPLFESFASEAAFLIWVFSLPSTPLRDFASYSYQAWNPVVILVGSVAIGTLAYVLGKNVVWQKVPGAGLA